MMTNPARPPKPAANAAPDIARLLRETIARDGPINVADFMAVAVEAYYAHRDPLGAAGDFITSPEISQMFGEMLGLWLIDCWEGQGSPPEFLLLELGPGRGTLMADILRTAERLRPAFAQGARLYLCEASPRLREAQAEALGRYQPTWVLDVRDIAETTLPLFAVANEFFDALPIRQFLRAPKADGWAERAVGVGVDGGFCFAVRPVAAPTPAFPPEARRGALWEYNPIAADIAGWLAGRIARTGGAAIICDYGYEGPAFGDTLQALCRHQPVDPLALPGESDLTAQVDFGALRTAVQAQGAKTCGPLEQGAFLENLGLAVRLTQLCVANPGQSAALTSAAMRLMDRSSPQSMGRLFKMLAIVPPAVSLAAGFQDLPA